MTEHLSDIRIGPRTGTPMCGLPSAMRRAFLGRHVIVDAPLHTALLGCAALAGASWLLSVVTRNYSWVDRLWSFAPPLYVAFFAAQAGFADVRLDLMLLLSAAWGSRLTYNFARKGGYRPSSEDYRWEVVRKGMHPAAYQLLNVVFIAGFQNVLLLGIALPAHRALASRAPLGPLDAIAFAAGLTFIVGEAIADQQQWRFQEDKRRRRGRGEPVAAEFLTTGLFRYSRHPNFFCEMAFWWSFALFAVAAGAPILDLAAAGALVLTLLFQGSTSITERLSLEKYPTYAEYQKTTSRLIPLPPR